jgi:GDPmannose 4,6-dehydratase
VREFCERAFGKVDLDYQDFVKTDEQFYRPAEVDLLMGNATKARRVLGWKQEYTFQQLLDEMVEADLAAVTRFADQSRSLASGGGLS